MSEVHVESLSFVKHEDQSQSLDFNSFQLAEECLGSFSGSFVPIKGSDEPALEAG